MDNIIVVPVKGGRGTATPINHFPVRRHLMNRSAPPLGVPAVTIR
ncbi:hypothetical protein [Streptomyces albipurpureus]|nr:hypothetical protein [Streptomyces sp. CWNU-1]